MSQSHCDGYWYTVKGRQHQKTLKDAFGVNLDDLPELNGLGEAHVLKPGQRLFLFGVDATSFVSEEKNASKGSKTRCARTVAAFESKMDLARSWSTLDQ